MHVDSDEPDERQERVVDDPGPPASNDLTSVPCSPIHRWDADQTLATIELAYLGGLQIPPPWNIAEYLATPLSPAQLAPILSEMRNAGTGDARMDQDAYITRLAILVTKIVVMHGQWSENGRKGTAWTLIYLGLKTHGYEQRNGATARQFLSPDLNFFEVHDTAAKLAITLGLAYQPGHSLDGAVPQAGPPAVGEPVDGGCVYEDDLWWDEIDGGSA